MSTALVFPTSSTSSNIWPFVVRGHAYSSFSVVCKDGVNHYSSVTSVTQRIHLLLSFDAHDAH